MKDNLHPMNIVKRMKAPTPPFWKKVRNISLILTGVAGAIIAAPIALPVAVVTFGSYLGLAGTIGAVLSQATSSK